MHMNKINNTLCAKLFIEMIRINEQHSSVPHSSASLHSVALRHIVLRCGVVMMLYGYFILLMNYFASANVKAGRATNPSSSVGYPRAELLRRPIRAVRLAASSPPLFSSFLFLCTNSCISHIIDKYSEETVIMCGVYTRKVNCI